MSKEKNQEIVVSEVTVFSLFKKKQFYGVIVAPDGQRFKFDFASVAAKLAEEKGEKLKQGIVENYKHGKDLYEEAEQEDEPPPVTTQFLNCYEDAVESGTSSAKFYALQEICGAALEAVEIAIYTEGSDEEHHEAHSYLNKAAKKDAEQRERKWHVGQERAAYWEGFDKGRAEAMQEMREREEKRKQQGWRRWFG